MSSGQGMVLGQAMFLGLTLVDCVARAGAVEELIHIFLMNEIWSHFVILTVALIAAAVRGQAMLFSNRQQRSG
jgi:hypothetical protein